MLSNFMWSLSSILSSRAPSPWASCYLFSTFLFSIVFNRKLAEETNTNASNKRAKDPARHKGAWSCPSLGEMKAFLALVLLMGIIRKPAMKLYWSLSSLLNTPAFSTIMARDRFMQIMRYLYTDTFAMSYSTCTVLCAQLYPVVLCVAHRYCV